MQSKQQVSSDQGQLSDGKPDKTEVLPSNWRRLLEGTFLRPYGDQRKREQRELAVSKGLPRPDSFETLCQLVVRQANSQPDSYSSRLAVRNLCERLNQQPSLQSNLSADVKSAVTNIFQKSRDHFEAHAKQGLAAKEHDFQARTADTAAVLLESMQSCAQILGIKPDALTFTQLSKLCMRAAQLELKDAASRSGHGDFKVISANLALRYVMAARQALHDGNIPVDPAIAKYLTRVDEQARLLAKNT